MHSARGMYGAMRGAYAIRPYASTAGPGHRCCNALSWKEPMPELPEVETVRRGLHEQLAGRTFAGLSYLEWPRTIEALT